MLVNRTSPGKLEANRVHSKAENKKSSFMEESYEGLTIVRAFANESTFSQKACDLTNDNLKTQIFMDSMHFYFQVRIFSMSNCFFMIIGAVCISLKG